LPYGHVNNVTFDTTFDSGSVTAFTAFETVYSQDVSAVNTINYSTVASHMSSSLTFATNITITSTTSSSEIQSSQSFSVVQSSSLSNSNQLTPSQINPDLTLTSYDSVLTKSMSTSILTKPIATSSLNPTTSTAVSSQSVTGNCKVGAYYIRCWGYATFQFQAPPKPTHSMPWSWSPLGKFLVSRIQNLPCRRPTSACQLHWLGVGHLLVIE
jgi:hypothetical protein